MYYKLKDNSQAVIDIAISAGDTEITLQNGGGAELPDIGAGETAKLVLGKVVSNPTVLNVFEKFEVVEMTAKLGDVLTVTRGQDGTTPQSFDGGDLVGCFVLSSHLEQLQDAVGGKANDSEVVHNTGNETVAGIKTFPSSPIVPVPETDYQSANKKFVEGILLKNIIPSLQNENHFAGEEISKGESIFVEDSTTELLAINEQAIGDVVGNKRGYFPIFGNGDPAVEIALNLATVGSPSVDFGIRIETDNGGLPSGLLVDPGATTTITAGSLTTSLAKAILSIGSNGDNASGVVYDASNSITNKTGYKISFENKSSINTITKDASCTATTCYLLDSDGVILDTQTFSAHVATFNYTVDIADYYIMVDSGGDPYTSESKNTVTFPIGNGLADYEAGAIEAIETINSINYATYDPRNNTLYCGAKITPISNCYVYSVTKNIGFTKAYILAEDLTILATADFSGDTASFDGVLLETGNNYYIVGDAGGATFLAPRWIGAYPTLPIAYNSVSLVGGYYNGADTPYYSSGINGIDTRNQANVIEDDTSGHNIESINFIDSFYLNEGQKYHLVAYQGVYDSETINASNYYKIGYEIKNTVTRGLGLFDGSSYLTIDTDKFVFIDSSLVKSKVFSLTDATYSYKLPNIPMIAKSDYIVGEKPLYDFDGITDGVTGTDGDNMFISDTPGALANTSGTNEFFIGKMISATELLIGRELYNLILIASTNLQISNDAEKTMTTTTFLKKKEIKMYTRGTVTLWFDIKTENASYTTYATVYINGVAVGVAQSNGTITYVTKKENFDVEGGDLVQIYLRSNQAGVNAYLSNMRMYFDYKKVAGGVVTL